MGIDPVSLAVMAGGQALGMVGSGMQAGQQAKAGVRQAAARNAVLKEQNAKLAGFRDQNYKDFDANAAGYQPTAQAGLLSSSQGARKATADAAIADATTKGAAGSAPVSEGPGGSVVRSDMADRAAAALSRTRATSDAASNLAGYGDQWSANEMGNKATARNIDVTNNFARGTAALTAPLMDFAQFQAYKPPSMVPQMLSSVGSLLSSYGAMNTGGFQPGSFGAGLGSIFNGGTSAPATVGTPAPGIPLPRPRPAGL